MSSRRTEAQIAFECTNEVCFDMPDWHVEGRWNADGEFEPNDPEDMECPECGVTGEPEDIDVEVADA